MIVLGFTSIPWRATPQAWNGMPFAVVALGLLGCGPRPVRRCRGSPPVARRKRARGRAFQDPPCRFVTEYDFSRTELWRRGIDLALTNALTKPLRSGLFGRDGTDVSWVAVLRGSDEGWLGSGLPVRIRPTVEGVMDAMLMTGDGK